MRRFVRHCRKASPVRLLRILLRAPDGPRRQRALSDLRGMGSDALLRRLQVLARSRSATRREVSLRVAGKLYHRSAGTTRPFAEVETQLLLLQGLQDPIPAVRCAAAFGISDRPHPDALPWLLRDLRHPNADLRYALSHALGRFEEPEAIEALIQLAGDPDTDVRNWATFGLGTLQEEADSPALRDLLARNLGDVDAEVRGEALCGLAARQDPRALAHLLDSPDVHSWRVFELNAAEQLADPRLLPQLRALHEQVSTEADIDGYWLGNLEAAIAACEGRA